MQRVLIATGPLLVVACLLAGSGGAEPQFAQKVMTSEAAAAPGAVARQAQTIKIGNSTYYTIPITRALSLIKSPWVRFVSSAIRLCRGANAHGFISANRVAAGVVAWVPTNLASCLEVTGGGEPAWQPCVQFYRTADGNFFVLYVGTNQRICADLSTQVPGGVVGRTNTRIGNWPAGTQLLIKCQRRSRTSQNGWEDYVAQYKPSLPASKWAVFVDDYYIDTGGRTRLEGVPTCGGISVRI